MSIFLKNSFFLRSLETRLLDWIDLLKSHRDCFRTIGFEVKIGGRGKGQELLTSYTLSFTVCDPSNPLWFPPLCGLCRSKHHGILSDVSCFSLSSLLLCPVDLPCSLLPDSPCFPSPLPPPPHFICAISVNHFVIMISGCLQKTRVLYSELWRHLNPPAKVSLAACSAQLPRRLIESSYVSTKQINKQNGMYTAHSEWPVTLVETYARHAIISS